MKYHDGRIQIKSNVPIPLRDGTVLRGDVYLPSGTGRHPVLLMRVPYEKLYAQQITYLHPIWYARHGYAVVVQNTRGRWDSDGEFTPFAHEAEDGYDTVEWAAEQPFCNGRVGMYGFSYGGATQLQAAVQQPPSLRAICPAMAAPQHYDGWAYQGGAFSLAFNLSWSVYLAQDTARRRGDGDGERELHLAFGGLAGHYGYLPLKDLPLASLLNHAPYYFDWLAHPRQDEYWERWNLEPRLADIQVPALHVGGWYDTFVAGTLKSFASLRGSHAGAQAAPQKLLVGPWYHMPWGRVVGHVDFGPHADNIIDELQLRWFDLWLKDDDSGILEEPSVQYFSMGENEWLTADEWPPAGTEQVPVYLSSGGRANSLTGDGRLTWEPPGDQPPDVLVYDPRAPVMSLGGHSCCVPMVAPMGPQDQRPVEALNEVLVYSSEPLREEIRLAGPVAVRLWASTSCEDTDFTAKLVHVRADGSAINLSEGVLRGRYRRSLTEPELLTPGEVYEFNISLPATANRFAPGEQIRLEISSSNFPHFDRNPNSGREFATDRYSDLRSALQTVLHDGEYPSQLLLPIVRR